MTDVVTEPETVPDAEVEADLAGMDDGVLDVVVPVEYEPDRIDHSQDNIHSPDGT